MNRFNKHFDQLKNDYLLLQETETFYSTDCLCMKNMSKVAQNQKTLIPQKMEKLLRRNKSKGTQVFSFFYKFWCITIEGGRNYLMEVSIM